MSAISPGLPSLDLVRQVTDRHVLGWLIGELELTRAELAARSGISKPTISESVRRLEEAGLLVESGKQSGKRGPSGTFYRLRDDAGFAVAVTISPAAVIAESCDLRGNTVRRSDALVPGPVTAAELEPVLRRLVGHVVAGLPGRASGTCVNVAGPVDQRDQRLVRLPNSPYFRDSFAPADLIRDQLAGSIRVDNDVNWAAAAEHAEGTASGLDDFLYAFLGPGIGSAIYAGGRLVRGHRGLAGELANVLTTGPSGRTRRLADCFADWGLRERGTEAIDLVAISSVLRGEAAADRRRREQIAAAVAGALGSLAAALDPEVILIAGPWGYVGGLESRIAELVAADTATRAVVRAAGLGAGAAHRGARAGALADARDQLLQRIA